MRQINMDKLEQEIVHKFVKSPTMRSKKSPRKLDYAGLTAENSEAGTKSEKSDNFKNRVYNPSKIVGWLKKGNEIKQKPLGGAAERVNINTSVSPSYRVQMSSIDNLNSSNA